MAQKAGLENARKTMVQSLSDQGVPPIHLPQLSGHKNLKGIENYSLLSIKQQQSISNTLANISHEKTVSLLNAAASNPLPLELRALAPPQQSKSITDQQSVALFSGAVIQKWTVLSYNINTVKQSPK